MRYFWNYLIPGILLIAVGFWSGAQSNTLLGLVSFLCFFVVGVTLIIEGKRKSKP